MRRQRGRPAHNDVLTPTEWHIAHAVQHGLNNRAIAARKGISVDGVKYHVSNILLKLHLRDRKALRQWFGVPANSAMARGESVSMSSTQLSGIGQITRQVGDLQQAIAWYGEVLGLPHLYTFGTMAFFDCGGTRLLLSQSEASPQGDSLLYFRVEDIAQTHARLQAQGVEFISAPHLIHRHSDGTEEWMAFFKDPDGRPLALMAQIAAADE